MSTPDVAGEVGVCSAPSVDDVLNDAFKRALIGGTGVVFIGVDYGKDAGSTEVEGIRYSDGSIEITSIRQWFHEIDAETVHHDRQDSSDEKCG